MESPGEIELERFPKLQDLKILTVHLRTASYRRSFVRKRWEQREIEGDSTTNMPTLSNEAEYEMTFVDLKGPPMTLTLALQTSMRSSPTVSETNSMISAPWNWAIQKYDLKMTNDLQFDLKMNLKYSSD